VDNDIVARLKDVDLFGVITLLIDARQEIERLRKELAAMREERDEVRQSYCSLMEAYRGGDGRVTANKLGWGYLFEEDGK
jgi:hypothetical protein